MARALVWLLTLACAAGAARAQEPAPCATPEAVSREGLTILRENLFDSALLDAAITQARAASGGEPDLEAVLAALPVSHTERYTPDDPAYYQLLDIFFGEEVPEVVRRCGAPDAPTYVGLGMQTAQVDGRAYIRAVLPGGPAEEAGLLRGDEIVAVEGAPFAPIASFAGKAGAPVTLSIRRQRESGPVTLAATPDVVSPQADLVQAVKDSAAILPAGGHAVGYIRMWSYTGVAYQDALVEALSEGPLADADGLVLDLRGFWGGASPDYAELFVGGAPSVRATGRDGEGVYLNFRWRRPLVVVIDETVRSGKELLADIFRAHGVPLVGANTAGAVTGGTRFVLGDGSLLMVATLDVDIDGRRLEGVGVAPTVPVASGFTHVIGADAPLDMAIRTLLPMIEDPGIEDAD